MKISMRARRGPLLAMAMLLLPLIARAAAPELVTMTATQRDNLGVQTEAPAPAQAYPLVTASGMVSVAPHASFMVTALHDGIVKRVLAGVGEKVKHGDLLAWIESPGVVDLQHQYLNALYAERLAAKTRDRDKTLLGDGIIPDKRYQQSLAAWQQAHARLLAMEQSLQQAGFSTADIDQLATSGALKRETPLRAPADGSVLAQLAGPGDHISANDPVYRLGDLSHLWVEIQLPAEEAHLAFVGQTVEVNGHTANVTQVAGAVNAATHTVLVRAVLAGKTGNMRPGTFANVTLMQPVAHAWSLPVAAVVSAGEKTVIFVLAPTGFRVQPVTVLGRGKGRVYLSGVPEAGMQAAVTGIAAIKAAWLGMGGE